MKRLMTPTEMRRRLCAGERAIDLVIEKWERILAWVRAGKVPCENDIMDTSCAFCELYIESNCTKCHIARASGRIGCQGTPWEDVASALRNALDPLSPVAAELSFLKAVRRGHGRDWLVKHVYRDER